MAALRTAILPRHRPTGIQLSLSLAALCACALLTACETVPRGAAKPGANAVPDVPVTQGRYVVGAPYEKNGVLYRPAEDWTYNEVGRASWYGIDYHGRRTANGETYDLRAVTAAHPTLPLPSRVRVTNIENGKSIEVRVNDRGPFEKGRLIDLSERAAELLAFKEKGTAMVRVEILGRAPLEVFRMAKPKDPATDLPVRAAPSAEVKTAVLPPPSAAPGEPEPPAQAGPAQVAGLGAAETPAVGAPADPVGELIDRISETVPAESEAGAATPAAETPPSAASLASSVARQFFIQAGAFTVPENAYSLRRLILKAIEGVNVSINPAQVGNREFFRVRVGPFASNEEAQVMLARLHNLGQNEAEIVID